MDRCPRLAIPAAARAPLDLGCHRLVGVAPHSLQSHRRRRRTGGPRHRLRLCQRNRRAEAGRGSHRAHRVALRSSSHQCLLHGRMGRRASRPSRKAAPSFGAPPPVARISLLAYGRGTAGGDLARHLVLRHSGSLTAPSELPPNQRMQLPGAVRPERHSGRSAGAG